MRISKKCEYALRAVFHLALRNSDQPTKIHNIAVAQNIPPRFLEVILNELKHAGFVDSRRGNEGGYLLARSAEELTVGDIMQAVQGPISVTAENSQEGGNKAVFFGSYAFEQLWGNVDEAISQICNSTTFAELVKSEMARKSVFVPNYTI